MTLPELILVEISIKRFGRKTNFICAGSSGYRLNMISESMFPFYGISKNRKRTHYMQLLQEVLSI